MTDKYRDESGRLTIARAACTSVSLSAIGYARTRDIFDCSELERAAHSLAHALSCLDTITASGSSASVQGGVGTGTITSSSSSSSVMSLGFVRSLEIRTKKLVDLLVARLKNRLEDMLTIVASASTISSSGTQVRNTESVPKDVASSSFPDIPFCHCLRALLGLDRSEVAERVVADTVVLPLARFGKNNSMLLAIKCPKSH